MAKPGGLLLRADASTRMGTGHVMRCLALAQAWQSRGGQPLFAMATTPEQLEDRLKAENVEIVRLSTDPGSLGDAFRTIQEAEDRGICSVVIDGYQFGYSFQEAIVNRGLNLLAVDDHAHAGRYCADIVLNQNAYAHPGLYTYRSSNTRLLLGARYTMLRREFLEWREWTRVIPEIAHRLLVSLGGSDPDNVTLAVIQALDDLEEDRFDVSVLVGAVNPHYETLVAAGRESRHSIHLLRNATNLPELMATADVAIFAGGSTCWEAVFMGLPCCIVPLVDHQVSVARILHDMGAAIDTGWLVSGDRSALVDAVRTLAQHVELRRDMSRRGRDIVDGYGAERVCDAIIGRRG